MHFVLSNHQKNKRKLEKIKYNVFQPLLLAIVLATGMLIGYRLNEENEMTLIDKVDGQAPGQTGRVEEILRFIENKYLYNTNTNKFIDKALGSIMEELDPYSIYVPPSKVEKIQSSLNANFTGMGITAYFYHDTLLVFHVLEDSPAAKAGIKPFDKILQVGNTIITGKKWNHNALAELLRKYKDKNVDIIVQDKDGNKRALTVGVKEIDKNTVVSSYRPDSNTVYMRIDRFSNHTYREFMKKLESYARDEKIHNLIIDLRDNPGGYLQEVTKILDQLFDKSKLDFVTTEYHDGRKDEIKSSGRNFYQIDNIIILINEHSASGSEVLAGVVQDLDRAVVIGKPSFGKGLVQEQYKLKNGGALRLTIANYYLPTGRSIQKQLDIDSSFVDVASSHYEKHDTFYSLFKHRPLLSGRGIYPDIIVNDTAWNQSWNYIAHYDSLLTDALIQYIFKHKELFDIDANTFVDDYKVDFKDDVFASLPLDWDNDYIATLVKAKLGYILYGEDVENMILEKIDPYILKAKENLKE